MIQGIIWACGLQDCILNVPSSKVHYLYARLVFGLCNFWMGIAIGVAIV